MLRPIDIIDKDNHLTGERSDPEDATNRGLWHRGAHIIILTPSRNVLVQKRDPQAIQYPGRVDIGVGGFVDSDETPEQTAIRETKEETGIDISHLKIRLLSTTKYNHHWKFNGRPKTSRVVLSTYVVQLDHDYNTISCESGEVAWAGFIPLRSALWLTHKGSLRRLGRLLPAYAYYLKTMRLAMDVVKNNTLH